MSKTASEYLVEAIFMTKGLLDGRATQAYRPCEGGTLPLTAGR